MATAEPVRGAAALAGWERTVVAGLPFQDLHGAPTGTLLAPRVLAAVGLRLLVRTEHGRPVAAVLVYVERRSVGIYWLATLPSRRRRGHALAQTTWRLSAGRSRT